MAGAAAVDQISANAARQLIGGKAPRRAQNIADDKRRHESGCIVERNSVLLYPTHARPVQANIRSDHCHFDLSRTITQQRGRRPGNNTAWDREEDE